MADKLGLGNEVRELKIGQSFTNPKTKAFHTLKYDFKPASVDTSKKANVEVPGVNQVTVTVPHLDGADIPHTVFKGSQKPYTKECVLIINRATGEITIEKLNCNIQVKKTRSEYSKPQASKADRLNPNNRSGNTSTKGLPLRSQTPPAIVGHRVSNKTKVTSGSRRADRQITQLVPKHSPLHASPSYSSPGHPVKSPKRDLHSNVNESHNQSTLASLPMIGVDDFSDPRPSSRNAPIANTQNSRPSQYTTQRPQTEKWPVPAAVPLQKVNNGVGEITDSSSSSSNSDSDSEEDTTITNKNTNMKPNGCSNGNPSPMKIDTRLLNDDLCLSESGSDSD
ncbi:ELL-associated factor [Leptinotarsa decemlineata]|uniref:ELL-associated factor n=1 Tax=Leptinotarsa decemlineata TaxID=7539 RepID=UPI000C2519DD|nr:ell-associated factor Eaf [Leptinotarsa decemlineata]XP_023018513.1 ell-associated factor Eaf [Leptinotarsa decemlineata]XP_023018517.1 ell-associated factor Eaf [Leptinotarsa decemlineata]